jgi:hypothetical protein
MKQLFALTALLFFLSGCEPKHTYAFKDANLTLKNEKEELLSKTHLAYWEAMSKKEFEKTYMYEMPYQRFIKPLWWYKEFNAGNNKHYQVIQKEIMYDDNHTAKVITSYIKEKTKSIFKDTWYYIDGIWYHKMKTSKLPE